MSRIHNLATAVVSLVLLACGCAHAADPDPAAEVVSLQGKGEFREAAVAFRVANRHRKSLKLTAITCMARVAPRMLLRHYKTHRSAEIAFVPKS